MMGGRRVCTMVCAGLCRRNGRVFAVSSVYNGTMC